MILCVSNLQHGGAAGNVVLQFIRGTAGKLFCRTGKDQGHLRAPVVEPASGSAAVAAVVAFAGKDDSLFMRAGAQQFFRSICYGAACVFHEHKAGDPDFFFCCTVQGPHFFCQ